MWKKRSILLIVGLLALIIGLFLLSYSDTFRGLIDSITLWAKDLMSGNPLLGALVFFLFSMLSAMLAFASSAALVHLPISSGENSSHSYCCGAAG